MVSRLDKITAIYDDMSVSDKKDFILRTLERMDDPMIDSMYEKTKLIICQKCLKVQTELIEYEDKKE